VNPADHGSDTALRPGEGTPADRKRRFSLAANIKWLFTELPFEQRFDAAATAGFTGVEYASPYSYPVEILKKRLDEAGLAQLVINTPMGEPGTPTRLGIACFPDRVSQFRAGVDQALDYATALGSEFLHVIGGITPLGVHPQEAFAQYVANIGWATERARGTGVRLLIEAQNPHDVPGFVLQSQARAATVVNTIAAEHLGLLFDVYHAHRAEADMHASLDRVWPHVRYVQVADAPGRHEPGTGDIDWSRVFTQLEEHQYQGWIGCEYAPVADTTSGLDWRGTPPTAVLAP
jgi:hydroxypyruvate isomerase